jgi:hypothetical protein
VVLVVLVLVEPSWSAAVLALQVKLAQFPLALLRQGQEPVDRLQLLVAVLRPGALGRCRFHLATLLVVLQAASLWVLVQVTAVLEAGWP